MLLAAVMPSAATDIITCSEEVENGMWVCFRKTFELAEAPSENTLRISADSKYRLYVNGEPALRKRRDSGKGRSVEARTESS